MKSFLIKISKKIEILCLYVTGFDYKKLIK